MVRGGLCPTQVTPQFPAEPGLTVRPLRSQPRGWRVNHTVPGTQEEGLRGQCRLLSLCPSLLSGPRIQLSRGGAAEEPGNQTGGEGRKALGQSVISLPPFPHPHPPSAKAWGCQLQPEMGSGGWGRREEGKTRGFLSPRTHTHPWFFPSASLGSGLGPPGAVVSEADRAALSLPACWKGWSWLGSWLRCPVPSSPSLVPQGLGVRLSLIVYP